MRRGGKQADEAPLLRCTELGPAVPSRPLGFLRSASQSLLSCASPSAESDPRRAWSQSPLGGGKAPDSLAYLHP